MKKTKKSTQNKPKIKKNNKFSPYLYIRFDEAEKAGITEVAEFEVGQVTSWARMKLLEAMREGKQKMINIRREQGNE